MTEKKLKEFINLFDIWVVSSGGVGSNYICDFLYDNNIKTHCRRVSCHGCICHLNKKLIPDKNCIYIYGDYEYAIKSQERRNLLKIKLKKLKRLYEDKIPENDPFLYKYQLENFKNTKNTYLLKYPYSKEDLIKCFNYFNLSEKIDYNKIQIKNRETNKDFKSKYENEIKYYIKF